MFSILFFNKLNCLNVHILKKQKKNQEESRSHLQNKQFAISKNIQEKVDEMCQLQMTCNTLPSTSRHYEYKLTL